MGWTFLLSAAGLSLDQSSGSSTSGAVGPAPQPRVFQGVTHVFWCARWMQLNIFPVSGSVLYMVGYCQRIIQQQSISKCGLQLLSPGAQGCLSACKTNLQWQIRACACPGAYQKLCSRSLPSWSCCLAAEASPGLKCSPLCTMCPGYICSNPDLMQQESPHQAAGAVLVPTSACHFRE